MLVGVNTLGLLPGYGGGEEVYLRHVLAKMRQLQSEVRFQLLTDEKNHASFDGWDRICTTATRDRASPSVFAQAVERATAQLKVDLLFSALDRAPVDSSVPLVLYTLDLRTWEDAAARRRWRAAHRLRSVKHVCAAARAIVVPSEFVRGKFLELLDVAMDKVIVAPLGVDDIFGLPQTSLAQKPYLLTVGTTHAYRNILRLIEVFSRLREEIPHALVVVGRPGDAEPSDWGPRVLRVHHFPLAQLAGLYQHCDVFICPSLYEGSGVTVLEAMRAGAPVVTGRVGGIPEVAKNTPIYCNPERVSSIVSTIQRALGEDSAARARRTRFGKKQAAEYTWELCAWKTLRAFRHR